MIRTNPINPEKTVEDPLIKIVELTSIYGVSINLSKDECSVVSYSRAYEIMIGIKEALKQKFPCPECKGGRMAFYNDFGGRVLCGTCKNAGIYIPESEA